MVNFQSLNPFSTTIIKATSSVSQLRVYPIKSCRGICVSSIPLTKQGLEFDRLWMFADATTKKFITIRDIPEMTLIDTAFVTSTADDSSSRSPPSIIGNESDLHLRISIRNSSENPVFIPARPTKAWLESNATLSSVEIWKSKTDGYIYSEEINAMFSRHLNREVVLVYKGPSPRFLTGNAAPRLLGREETTNFPDAMPLQIANEASISELNRRLKAKGQDEITIERFRPNIIVRGGDKDGMPPWIEDEWKTVRIVTGEAPSSDSWFKSVTGTAAEPPTLDIDVAARCARCQVPNVNPETAEKNKREPWDTLVSYRRIDKGIKFKPCFGMLSVPRQEGAVKVGTRFEVVETTENHMYVKGF